MPNSRLLYNIGLTFIAIFLPPLAVALKNQCRSGKWGEFFLNLILTILGFIPGIIHAIYVIFSTGGRGGRGKRTKRRRRR